MDIGSEDDPGRIEIFDTKTVTLFKEIIKGVRRNPINGEKKGGTKIFTKINL